MCSNHTAPTKFPAGSKEDRRSALHRQANETGPGFGTAQGDAKVFKKYSQMKLQMKREALAKLNRKQLRHPLVREGRRR